jgi:hypothetical protein
VERERKRIEGLRRGSLKGEERKRGDGDGHDLATILALTGQAGTKGGHRCAVVGGVIVLCWGAGRA